jgi:hypothetical protein
MNWNDYFAMMEDWKRLPAYKAEPRIDSFIGFYLPDMASDFLKDKIIGIIPELPIRLGTVEPDDDGKPFADRSYKVDFYLLGISGKHYFAEFKTDSGSRREGQDKYLQKSKDVGMAAIVGGIMRIASVSSYRTKYDHLLKKLKELGLIDEQKKYSGKTDNIEIVYVQPHRKDEDKDQKHVIDFRWMSNWLTDKSGSGDFEAALSKTLSNWSND